MSKGLSFAPSPDFLHTDFQIHIITQFDDFARSIRSAYIRNNNRKPSQKEHATPIPTDLKLLEASSTPNVFRKMKFLRANTNRTPSSKLCDNARIENYIHRSKLQLDSKLPEITSRSKPNVTPNLQKAINHLKKSHAQITIKPADKNLGIVILDTDDYVIACTSHLANPHIYQLSGHFPTEQLTKLITDVLIAFRHPLHNYSKKLYTYLLPPTKHRTPQFYGLPKLHKDFVHTPPIRPIVSHSNSLLSHTATFIDHVLQPLAQSYPDYLHNSTSLINLLENFPVPADAILVSADVNSLYPSIPQTECLQLIYEEMCNHQDLLLFDPNLIIRLLHLNVNYNFFEFASLIFHQLQGTAMGAAFSPTVANIFMSVFFLKFLSTCEHQPLFLKRYIDDVFIIWPNRDTLHQFITAMNDFHPCITFKYTSSESSTDFLDTTIYKGERFLRSHILDFKTFQKAQNLYQYLHYSSCHPKSAHKGIVVGECIRYIRTNSSVQNYSSQVHLFRGRLLKRGYPACLIDRWIHKPKFTQRPLYLCPRKSPPQFIARPIMKCLTPPNFTQLKTIILQGIHTIRKLVPKPLFISLSHATLHNCLVRARLTPTEEQLMDILCILSESSATNPTVADLPTLKNHPNRVVQCHHPRCSTCHHINTSRYFRSTTTTITYPIRHNFSCSSTNVIYLITCTKCRKQYVGMTTRPLRERINHHRTSVQTRQNHYVSRHFNFSDHSITDLSVQPIDTLTHPTTQQLQALEQFWINTLKTERPLGLNNSLQA